MQIIKLFSPKRAQSAALLLGFALSGCILYPESPGEIRTFVHPGLSLRDSTGWHSDTSLYSPNTYGFRTEPGEANLFEYYHKAADQASIADDEFSESLYFMVPAGSDSVVIDTAGFSTYRARYMSYCFCSLSYGVVDSGRIVVRETGNGKYRVEADIGFAYRSELELLDSTYIPARGKLKFTRTFNKK